MSTWKRPQRFKAGDVVTADTFNNITESIESLKARADEAAPMNVTGLALAALAVAGSTEQKVSRRRVLGLGWLHR